MSARAGAAFDCNFLGRSGPSPPQELPGGVQAGAVPDCLLLN